MFEMQAEKLHAACDECRMRKLKCSGEMPACSRCEREKINCVYSPQKPMGRPRKRRREDAGSEQTTSSGDQAESSTTSDTSYGVPHFTDMGLISPPDLNDLDFSGFADFGTGGDVALNTLAHPLGADAGLVNGFGHGHSSNLDFGISPIDPSLWNTQLAPTSLSPPPPTEPDIGPCSCLSLMYLTLSDLQSMPSFSFPAVIPRLRSAMDTASAIIHCPKCPKENFTAIQNVQSLSALLTALGERFHRVLTEIDAEAARLEETGQKKPFRIGDNSAENAHLHTGTLNCPMGFDIQLEGKDWKKLAKQALRTEVLGGGCNKRPLVWLLEEMEKRQKRWHEDHDSNREERERMWGSHDECHNKGEEATCLKMIKQIRTMIGRMKWD